MHRRKGRAPTRVVVCGGGNAAHALIPIIKESSGVWMGVFAPHAGESDRLRQGISAGGVVAVQRGREVRRIPDAVSSSAEEIIPGADVIILAVPAFAHANYLQQIAPYLKDGAWLGAMPARSGFEFYSSAGALHGKRVALFAFQTLPWACRVVEYGKLVHILGQKARVGLAAIPASETPSMAESFQQLLGLPVVPLKCMTAVSLGNVGQIIHPGIMYGLFKGRETGEYDEAGVPLFYQGVDEDTARMLELMSDEIRVVAETISARSCGRLDLSEVPGLKQWLLESYSESISDKTSVRSCLNTNSAYAGLKAPVTRSGSRYRPDLGSRYLVEDVPYGLVVTKGMADLCGASTPAIDEVLDTTSRWMGTQFYQAGKPSGKDMLLSRHPIVYGITTLDQLIQLNTVAGEPARTGRA